MLKPLITVKTSNSNILNRSSSPNRSQINETRSSFGCITLKTTNEDQGKNNNF